MSKTHQMSKTKFYTKWSSMRQRCNDHNNHKFKNYGARGIKVLWKSFEEFRDAMHQSYLEHVKKFGEKNTQIERIDNDKSYSTKNCRWATPQEQMQNKTTNINITYNEKTFNIKQWSKILNIKYSTLHQRIVFRKWSIEKSFHK